MRGDLVSESVRGDLVSESVMGDLVSESVRGDLVSIAESCFSHAWHYGYTLFFTH